MAAQTSTIRIADERGLRVHAIFDAASVISHRYQKSTSSTYGGSPWISGRFRHLGQNHVGAGGSQPIRSITSGPESFGASPATEENAIRKRNASRSQSKSRGGWVLTRRRSNRPKSCPWRAHEIPRQEEAEIDPSFHSPVCHIKAWDSHLRASDDGEGEVLSVMTHQK